MKSTRYYKIENENNTYRVIALRDGYNLIEDTFYFYTKEEALDKVKEEMLND